MKLNLNTEHPSAFISSTFVDLYEDRKIVANALKARSLNVNALDINPASSRSSKEKIQRGIEQCDFLILIVGDRYGSILPSMTGSTAISITHWEYNLAYKLGKPVLAYFKNVDKSDPRTHDEKDSEYDQKRRSFNIFKKIVTHRHNPSYFTNPTDLAEEIDQALINVYREGVISLTEELAEVSNKLASVERELEIVTKKLSEANTSNPMATKTSPLNTTGMGMGLGLADLERMSVTQPTRNLGLSAYRKSKNKD